MYINRQINFPILHCFMYQTWIRQFSLAIYQQYFTLFHVSVSWIRQFSLAISIVFYTVSCIRPVSGLVFYNFMSGLDKTIQSSYIYFNSILHCFMYQAWIRQFSLAYINSILHFSCLHCFMYQAWIRQFSLAISIVFYTVSCIRPG